MFKKNSKIKTSRIEKFYTRSFQERLKTVQQFAELTEQEINLFAHFYAADSGATDYIVENLVSLLPVPLGIATNFIINDKEYLIPMATEEPSVIAGASYAAKLARPTGGFCTKSSPSLMTGQIQLINIHDIKIARKQIKLNEQKLLDRANKCDPVLITHHGGARSITTRTIKTTRGPMLIVQIEVDVQDAMGANIVNTMAEAIAPLLEKLTAGTARAKIVSNLALNRIAHASAVWSKKTLGKDVINAILDLDAFAHADHLRAATHNKGIMNGIDAVVLATGNDCRAIEAGAHAYAAYRKYHPLSKYTLNSKGDLVGSISLPLAVGVVGGATKNNPIARVCLKLLGVQRAQQLAEIIIAVGLAQNFAALRALASEGIQRGHMALHARGIVLSLGTPEEYVDIIAHRMIKEKKISYIHAQELLTEIEKKL